MHRIVLAHPVKGIGKTDEIVEGQRIQRLGVAQNDRRDLVLNGNADTHGSLCDVWRTDTGGRVKPPKDRIQASIRRYPCRVVGKLSTPRTRSR